MMIREWIELFRLARRRFNSLEDYHRFQVYQGGLVLAYLRRQGIQIRDKRVLDVGSGVGGYSRAMESAGADVVSVDLSRSLKRSVNLIIGDGMHLPIQSNRFDVVFCASLIEHVPHPVLLLNEMARLVRHDGIIYLSFPPFYSPVGGHQFKPYHLLGERWALYLSGQKVDKFATACGSWGLFPLTIRRARRLIAEAGLIIKHESTRYFPINLAHLPWLGEVLTWHVQFVLSKDG